MTNKSKNMIENYKKIRLKKRLRRLRLIIFMSLKSTAMLTCMAGFIVVSVPLFSAFEAHIINVTARIENDIPSIDPPSGYFCNDGSLTIKLYTSLAEASIIYTIDGSDPDCFIPNGTVYDGTPFPLTYSATVKARTCHDDDQSIIISEDYIVTSEYCVEEKKCDALSIGYWQNHEGCPTSSIWTVEIQELSLNEFSGAFSTISGADICFYLAPSNCPGGGTVEGQLCRAKGKALANLSNIVSNRLDLNALIAGADDGNEAFDNLGSNSSSTVREALIAIENIIINSNAAKDELEDAAYVAERIYTFYEEENPDPPWCIYPETDGSATFDLFSSPSVSDAMIVDPPIEGEPAKEPPIEEFQEEESPADESIGEEPPVGEEPSAEPLIDEIPVDEPVNEEPPAEEKSIIDPSIGEEPATEEFQEEDFVSENPLAEESVVEDLLTDETPLEESPVEEEPVTEPLADEIPPEDPVEEDPPVEDPDPGDPPTEEPAE